MDDKYKKIHMYYANVTWTQRPENVPNFFSNKSTWSCSHWMINTKNHMYYANITWTQRPENVPNFFFFI